MIRTVVVDDEPYLRNSIKLSIENTNSDFMVIAEAGNGIQAYDLIAELQPDVVFLDIRMPLMDGIALLDKLHKNGICPIRVILSGYSEFEYAKKAIQFGVFDYVLKPIHLEQLSDLLANIADRVMQKRIHKEYEYLHYILKGIKPSDPPEKLSLNMQRYMKYYCFCLIAGSYMYTKNNQFIPAGDFWNSHGLLVDIEKLCSPNGQLWFISGENQNEMFLIIGITSSKSDPINQPVSQIRQICDTLPVPITMVFAESETDPEALRETVIHLKYASINNTYFGHSSFIALNEALHKKQGQSLLTEENIRTLQNCIQEKRYQDFKQSIKRLMDLFNRKKILQQQLKLELIRILEILRGDYLSSEIQDFVDESITNAFNYDDITEIMFQYIDDYSKDYYSDASQDLANLIKDYIDEYYESQLTLKDIATHFHISPSYLSNVFKKAFHESPNEYIMNKRILKSKDLLSVFPPIKVKKIAGMIGYTDPFYFSRIFKLMTGVTPTEYRINLSKKELE